MRRGLLILATLCLVGVAVLSRTNWRFRKAYDRIENATTRNDRYVDVGVRLVVVRHDPDGEIRLPGKPRLTKIREHVRGNIIDTASVVNGKRRPTPCASSLYPTVWYCSEQGEEVILHPHGTRGQSPPAQLVYGAMGAGKTTTTAQWLWFRVLELMGLRGEVGVTAPTNLRMSEIKAGIMELWPSAWWHWTERHNLFRVVTGLRVRLVSTHERSKEAGSPIQGWNWLACASEEIQDSLRVDGDIEARGRAAPEWGYKRLANATAKDDPNWRDWRDKKQQNAIDWIIRRMDGPSSPFVFGDKWERLARNMSPREYARKVMAQDVASDDRTYTSWDREFNVRPLPIMGAKDVTSVELGRIGYRGYQLLAGHDPGKSCRVTEFLKAYQFPGEQDPVWFVVGELTTERDTTEAHGVALKEYVKKRWGDIASLLIHIDPHSNGSENDSEHPDWTVTTTLKNLDLHVRQAAYQLGTTKPGRIGRKARVEMVNTLLCSAIKVKDAKGQMVNLRRLFVACDDKRNALAPKLVEAFERLENDTEGNPDRGKKGAGDFTHWAAALGYALWKIEKPRLDAGRGRSAG